MALYTFGGTPADVLTTAAGDVVPDYPVLVRVAGTGQLVTALYEVDGTTPIGELRTNPAGSSQPGALRPFKTDVPAIEFEYNDAAGEPIRWYEAGREVAQEALAAALDSLSKEDGGTVEGPLVAAAGLSVVGGLDVTGGANVDELDVAGGMTVGGIFAPSSLSLAGMRIYNPRVLGAVGDGTHDDAPAVQAALDAAYAAGGGWVIVPSGTYRLATLPLRIRRNTRLTLMPGARMVRAAAVTMLLNGDSDQTFGGYTGHGNIVVEGGVWDMAGTVVTPSNMCMSFGHASNVTVRDTTVLDLPGYHGIEYNSIKTGRVLNCNFLGYIDPGGRDFSEAIQLDLAKGTAYFGGFGPADDTACVDILIDGCTVGPSGTAGTTAWPRGIGSHSASPNKPHRDVRVKNCRFESCAQFAIGAYTWEGVVIEGVQMRGCGAGIRVRTLDSSTASHRTPAGGSSPTITGSQPLTGFAINDMTFVGGGSYDAAIRIEGEDTGYVGLLTLDQITIKDVAGIGVRLMNVEDYTAQKVIVVNAGGTGISQFGTRRGRVTDCTVNGAGSAGITADSRSTPAASATDVAISGCTVTGTAANGVHIWDGTDVVIDDCDVYALTGYGVQISTNTNRPIIRNVRTRATTLAGINVTSTVTGAVRRGNTADAPSASTLATVASTTAETVLATWTIPANDAAAGTAYRFTAQGTASTTGTPTLTIRVRLGGAAGAVIASFTAVTTSSGISGRGWRVDGALLSVAPGSSGAWAGGASLSHHLASTTGAVQNELTDAAVTRDSTADQQLVVTAQWSASSASNTATTTAGSFTRAA
ncbi:right-handed parallel beta-helix repeat-containing protein [Streptomyces caniferus]|uniref:right-handed parallel beta-helix repeat-containing protein n=1 Tax=Streptomyces caniferus TaxID=285557 RepID=UPI0038309226